MIDLNTHVTNCYLSSRQDRSPREATIESAVITGRHAARLGMTEKELGKWLQVAYGSIWVRLSGLNPGADLKEVWKALQHGYRGKKGVPPKL